MKKWWQEKRLEILIGFILGIIIVVNIEYFFGGFDGICRSFQKDILEQSPDYEETPLHKAVRHRAITEIQKLLDEGTNIDVEDEQGFTPLHVAAVHGHIKTAEFLLNHGADINKQNSKHGITPLYIAMVAQQDSMAAFLKEQGADDSITDMFDQTPAEAASVMKKRADKKLLWASKSKLPFDKRSIVMIPYVGHAPNGNMLYKGIRMGFAVCDGCCILTAAHCVDEFVEDIKTGSLVIPIVISPYYGDAFETEIILIDKDADWAILRAPWDSHPALPIASKDDLSNPKEMMIAAYPPLKNKKKGIKNSKKVRCEKINFLKTTDENDYKVILLRGAKYAGPGWSGSPMILANGKTAGVFTRHRYSLLDGVVLFHNPMGPSIVSFLSSMEEKGIDIAVENATNSVPTPKTAEKSFNTILEHSEFLVSGELQKAMQKAQEWVKQRPQSMLAHLSLASCAEIMWSKDKSNNEYKELSDTNYKNAVTLNPSSSNAHAQYASFLISIDESQKALNELEHALAIEPDLVYAKIKKLHALNKLNPTDATKYGEELVQDDPSNTHYWRGLAGAYKETGEHEKEIEIIRNHMKSQRGPLADALARAGKLEEAEARYKHNLENHPCAWCWFAYAKFLAEYDPTRIEDVKHALDNAIKYNKQHQLVNPTEIKKLQDRLNNQNE